MTLHRLLTTREQDNANAVPEHAPDLVTQQATRLSCGIVFDPLLVLLLCTEQPL
jgi:hypothetical protein